MISEKRRLANQRNALKSTGPRTEAGKMRSRRNALKHGLTGAGVVLSRPDNARFQACLKELNEHLQPIDTLERILVRRVALATMRVEKAARKEIADVTRGKTRALRRWEQKQLHAVDEAVGRLAIDPARASEALSQTSFGCEWLIQHWVALASVLEQEGTWTQDEATLALALCGHRPGDPLPADAIPAALWGHAIALATAPADEREPIAAALRAIMSAEVAALEAQGDRLWHEQDGPAREAVEDSAGVDTSDRGSRLMRYDTRNDLILHRNLNQLLRLRKIEPEHQSVERWHKTGKMQTRRWAGTQWEPTHPYVTTSVPEPSHDDPESPRGNTSGTEVLDAACAPADSPPALDLSASDTLGLSAESARTTGQADHAAMTGPAASPSAAERSAATPHPSAELLRPGFEPPDDAKDAVWRPEPARNNEPTNRDASRESTAGSADEPPAASNDARQGADVPPVQIIVLAAWPGAPACDAPAAQGEAKALPDPAHAVQTQPESLQTDAPAAQAGSKA